MASISPVKPHSSAGLRLGAAVPAAAASAASFRAKRLYSEEGDLLGADPEAAVLTSAGKLPSSGDSREEEAAAVATARAAGSSLAFLTPTRSSAGFAASSRRWPT